MPTALPLRLLWPSPSCLPSSPAPHGTANAQANKDDLAATVAKLNKKALDEYDNLNFEEARKILKDALDFCKEAGLTSIHHRAHQPAPGRGSVDRVQAARRRGEVLPQGAEIPARHQDDQESGQPRDPGGVRRGRRVAGQGKLAAGRRPPRSAVAPTPGICTSRSSRAARGRGSDQRDARSRADRRQGVCCRSAARAAPTYTARDMREATPGNFIAEIPAAAAAATRSPTSSRLRRVAPWSRRWAPRRARWSRRWSGPARSPARSSAARQAADPAAVVGRRGGVAVLLGPGRR